VTFERVMVTGHRPQYMSTFQAAFATSELERLAAKLAAAGTRVGISGMALGADRWWADAVIAAGLDLWSFIPFPQQAARWREVDRAHWQYLRGRAVHEHVTSLSYSVPALHQRNDDMLDAADAVIAVWSPSKTTGGTASCVQKAMRRGMPIIIVDLDAMETSMRMPTTASGR